MLLVVLQPIFIPRERVNRATSILLSLIPRDVVGHQIRRILCVKRSRRKRGILIRQISALHTHCARGFNLWFIPSAKQCRLGTSAILKISLASLILSAGIHISTKQRNLSSRFPRNTSLQLSTQNHTHGYGPYLHLQFLHFRTCWVPWAIISAQHLCWYPPPLRMVVWDLLLPMRSSKTDVGSCTSKDWLFTRKYSGQEVYILSRFTGDTPI